MLTNNNKLARLADIIRNDKIDFFTLGEKLKAKKIKSSYYQSRILLIDFDNCKFYFGHESNFEKIDNADSLVINNFVLTYAN